MIKGFKNFITRGNVIDLAVAVVIGAAFTGVVNALVQGLINPLVAAIFGEPNLYSVGNFTLNGAEFSIGVILTAILNFLLVAAAIYVVIVLPINTWNERRKAGVAEDVEESEDIVLLREIRDALQARGSSGPSQR